jgi:hypothetical protein
MTVLNLVVSASTDDTDSASNATGTGGSGFVAAGDLTQTLLSPGSHGAGNFWYVGCRFLNVTIAQAATISSAIFSMENDTGYTSPGTISLLVSCEKHTTAANPITFDTTTGGNLSTTARPRTTANTTWDQKTTPGTPAYQTVDITSAVQEVINQTGWTSGWSIVVIVESNATTTAGEWQDYVSKDNTKATPPKLDITYGAAGTGPPPPFPPLQQTVYRL